MQNALPDHAMLIDVHYDITKLSPGVTTESSLTEIIVIAIKNSLNLNCLIIVRLSHLCCEKYFY